MWGYAQPILYGLFLWWFSTGAVLYVVGLPGRRRPWVLAGAALMLAGSLAVLVATRADASVAGAYAAFTAGLLVWGALEIAFLTGWITGPWRAACPEGARGVRRVGYAIAAILYHELSLLAAAAVVTAIGWGQANWLGPATFGVLLVMRVSAKLNVFLGVPNVTDGFLPDEIAYLKSFFAKRPMNLLFPLSITGSTIALTLLVGAVATTAEPFMVAGLTLVATLVGLALLEHWFLVMPLPVEALWAWGMLSRDEGARGASVVSEPVAPEPINLVRLDQHLGQRSAGSRAAPGRRPAPLRAVEARMAPNRLEQGGQP